MYCTRSLDINAGEILFFFLCIMHWLFPIRAFCALCCCNAKVYTDFLTGKVHHKFCSFIHNPQCQWGVCEGGLGDKGVFTLQSSVVFLRQDPCLSDVMQNICELEGL